MTYRIMLLVELTKLSDMSDNFVVIKEYSFRLLSNLSLNGMMIFPQKRRPSPSPEFVT